jgi:hypothetical protein
MGLAQLPLSCLRGSFNAQYGKDIIKHLCDSGNNVRIWVVTDNSKLGLYHRTSSIKPTPNDLIIHLFLFSSSAFSKLVTLSERQALYSVSCHNCHSSNSDELAFPPPESMPDYFLQQELYRIPVPIGNSWPHTDASWLNFAPLFMMGSAASFETMPDQEKLEFCNAQLRFHMNSARWYGRWRKPFNVQDNVNPLGLPLLPPPPIAVPELSLVTSGTFMARTLYGAFVRCSDLIHILLTVA